MDKHYHFTTLGNLYSIAMCGLVPQNGDRCKSIRDDCVGVFVSKGIKQSIIMYALMYGFYRKHVGAYGDKVIREMLDEIRSLENTDGGIIKKEYSKLRIAECNEVIQSVCQMRSYGSFTNYLGGEGCFLSINDIYVEDNNHPENCCYKNIIPSNLINVLSIKGRTNNYKICSLGPVLAYLLDCYPFEVLKREINEDNISDVYQLYIEREKFGMTDFNMANYELVEEPIKNFFPDNIKRKTLV